MGTCRKSCSAVPLLLWAHSVRDLHCCSARELQERFIIRNMMYVPMCRCLCVIRDSFTLRLLLQDHERINVALPWLEDFEYLDHTCQGLWECSSYETALDAFVYDFESQFVTLWDEFPATEISWSNQNSWCSHKTFAFTLGHDNGCSHHIICFHHF